MPTESQTEWNRQRKKTKNKDKKSKKEIYAEKKETNDTEGRQNTSGLYDDDVLI